MITAGNWHELKVVKSVDFGLYLDGDDAGEILLPKRFMPAEAVPGDVLRVFVYHDSENRLIATTQTPLGIVGDIVSLRAVSVTRQGAFLDWGLMKDLFVPLSQQTSRMVAGGKYLVRIYVDEQTGRVAATERIAPFLSNETLTVQVNDPVQLIIWYSTDIGFKAIINNRHTGVLHFSDVFGELEEGTSLPGFIKTIREDNKIDVVTGTRGYARVAGETGKIMELLGERNGYLPFNDKSDPDEIYALFGMSKKTFKMSLGKLLKEGKIEFTQTGFKAK